MAEGLRRESRRELSNQTFVRSKSNSAVQNLTIDNHGIVLSIQHVFAFRAKAAARSSRNSSDASASRVNNGTGVSDHWLCVFDHWLCFGLQPSSSHFALSSYAGEPHRALDRRIGVNGATGMFSALGLLGWRRKKADAG